MKVFHKRYYLLACGVMAVGALASVAVLALHRTDPAYREARFLKRGKERMDAKDYPRAMLEFQNAIQAMPKDPEPYYQLALASLKQTPDLQGPVQPAQKGPRTQSQILRSAGETGDVDGNHLG